MFVVGFLAIVFIFYLIFFRYKKRKRNLGHNA